MRYTESVRLSAGSLIATLIVSGSGLPYCGAELPWDPCPGKRG